MTAPSVLLVTVFGRGPAALGQQGAGAPRLCARSLDAYNQSARVFGVSVSLFQQIGPLLGSPDNKDHGMVGSLSGPLIFGNSHFRHQRCRLYTHDGFHGLKLWVSKLSVSNPIVQIHQRPRSRATSTRKEES